MGCVKSKDPISSNRRVSVAGDVIKNPSFNGPVIRSVTQLRIHPRTFLKLKFGGLSSDYELLEIIGEGTFAEVKKCYHNPSRSFRALKRINKTGLHIDQLGGKLHLKEMAILRELDHPNVLKCFEFFEDDKNFYIVMEYCGGGELFKKILDIKRFSENEAADIMSQLLSCVAYCHSKRIVHRDLKPENILVEEEGSFNIKIADFGSSCMYDSNRVMSKCFGSAYYIAPEVIRGHYTELCDEWSCGVIMYILLTGKPPYSGKNETEILEQIKTSPLKISQENLSGLSEACVHLITQLLQVDPDSRIPAKDALIHPWIQRSRRARTAPNLSKALNELRTFQRTTKLKEAIRVHLSSQIISQEDAQELKQSFHALDKNGDGKITKEELSEIYKMSLGQDEAVKEAERIMDEIDRDRNGYIDYSEFLQICLQENRHLSKENLIQSFKVFDADSDGKISAEELKNVLETDELAADHVWSDLIKEADTNGDGVIDLKEFISLMSKKLR
ncbi:unnamed protein product [Blepharisma stoltei]|uniref:non-specific serine/threonine protein kinase n=1 Tax=Blepharisma stoltei TaxID=1481888 RepID=A0AAU9J0J3_9CILI|nr:unnamed protein product [Blepharisma stoltei]